MTVPESHSSGYSNIVWDRSDDDEDMENLMACTL